MKITKENCDLLNSVRQEAIKKATTFTTKALCIKLCEDPNGFSVPKSAYQEFADKLDREGFVTCKSRNSKRFRRYTFNGTPERIESRFISDHLESFSPSKKEARKKPLPLTEENAINLLLSLDYKLEKKVVTVKYIPITKD